MKYWKYTFEVDSEHAEILLAFLSEWPFDSFQETETGLDAYLPEDLQDEVSDEAMQELADRFKAAYSREELPDINWNATWEANFHPIIIDRFCAIRADFHDPIPKVKYEIIINPKMAFGTGHHDTTWMMMSAMRDLDLARKKVLDFGCGTGILAILAAKMGATMIDAVDIELPAYENALENIQINNSFNVHVFQGSLNVILDTSFDFILANINRNVILETLPTLHKKLNKGGILLISGILRQDEDIVLETARQAGYTVDEKFYRNEWCCFQLFR
ncbi:MAG: 50S ribosomal protein L11 methyltransferase [Saprospiraceae bacterium]|nr:50S ribosomal protein L11 methyltransferase [Lewinella sp.]